jgi:hypothetical protein
MGAAAPWKMHSEASTAPAQPHSLARTLCGSRQEASADAEAMVTEEAGGSLSVMAFISFSFSSVPCGRASR